MACAESSAHAVLPKAYEPFLAPPDPGLPAGAYTILKPDTPRLEGLNTAPTWSNEVWRMGPAPGGRWAIEIYDVIRARWVPVANLAPDFSEGRIQPFAGRRAAPGAYALNYPYDQAILMNRLLQRDVLILHGAGLVHESGGYVFFGPSGIGKTTISRLWQKAGAHLLNDDRVALHAAGADWHVAGTPWHGEEPYVSPRTAPLRGIVRLRQARTGNSVRRLSLMEGLAELMACALVPFHSRNGIERALDLATRLAEAVPFMEFSFRPEPAAVEHFLRAVGTR